MLCIMYYVCIYEDYMVALVLLYSYYYYAPCYPLGCANLQYIPHSVGKRYMINVYNASNSGTTTTRAAAAGSLGGATPSPRRCSASIGC